jgi:putative membrane-bound dehydrogenase-like protein
MKYSSYFVALSLAWTTSGSLLLAEDFPVPYNTEPADVAPMPAEQAALTAKLPAGFRCEVFASEPDVQQPIAMCFDARGRLWVAECYTYAERPPRWDMELRDRIVVLEDTDNDGRSDKRTVFWDQGQRLTSIAWGPAGVWALCAPELLFIADSDSDLKPDAEPQVLLDGFDATNIGHNVVNGLKLGPDGWLYGRHGITATSLVGPPDFSDSQRATLNCSIWRYHPPTQKFEVFCQGGTNPWGLDWDANGQLFYTNTVIGHLWHAIPGAYYQRMFGAHLNPTAYEVIGHTADHYHWDTGQESWSDIRDGITSSTSALGGGHAHMGCLIYQGGVWPAEYQGKLFTCNLHGNRVNMDILERQGCGYVAHHGPDFMLMQDSWFRGLDLLTGPDGQVWINDWSDTGECHDNSGVHRTSGRIYRVIYDGPERGAATPQRPDWLRARGTGSLSWSAIEQQLSAPDEGQRALAVRWLAEDSPTDATTLERMKTIARQDPSGLVRLEVAAALQRLPIEHRLPLARILAAHASDADDRQQPLMLWYGISEAVPLQPTAAIELVGSTSMSTLRRLVARRLCEQIDEKPASVEQLLTAIVTSPAESLADDVLAGMNEALRGRSQAQAPSNWEKVTSHVQEHGTQSQIALVRELSVLFGDGRAREQLLAIAGDNTLEAGARRSALESLLRNPTPDLLPQLKNWINDKILSREAARGLAFYEGPGISERLINFWQRDAINRTVAIDALISRVPHAMDLVKALDDGSIPRNAITPYQARQIYNLGNEELNSQLRDLWGEIRESPEEKQRELAHWKTILTAEVIGTADPANGKLIYQKSCAACHQLYDEGGKLGPNLTGSDRHNLDYLLGNMIDPNAIVPADYRMTIFVLDDGQVVTGVVAEENQRSITVQQPERQVVLDLERVTARKTTAASLMPEGLLTPLDEKSVRDLVAYLMTTRP